MHEKEVESCEGNTCLSQKIKPGKTRNFVIIGILGLLIVIAFMISMDTGFIRLTPLEVIRTLFGYGTDKQHLILFEFRLPRIVISVLVGMGLAVSGCVLQGFLVMRWLIPEYWGLTQEQGLLLCYTYPFPNHNSRPRLFLAGIGVLGAG